MTTVEAPDTIEGWYVQHDLFTFQWSLWRTLAPAKRNRLIEEAAAWLKTQMQTERGDSAAFNVVGHKGDVLLTHFRPSLEALNQVKVSLRQTEFFAYLEPVYGYLSVIELGMYEVIGVVKRKLEAQGLEAGTEAYHAAYQEEMEQQKEVLQERLYPEIPAGRYQCFYPMNKRRGVTHNWYTLSMDERRSLMRGHGMTGRRYAGRVKQIISGSVGLDDWEWGVSLFSDDPLVFKKLVYEMRFDAASSLYGEFGEFFVGIRFEPEELGHVLSGTLAAP
jgi:chlorite dismutase